VSRRRHFGSVRRFSSGRYQASYWHEGRRIVAPGTFKFKADALAYLGLVETDMRRGVWREPMAERLTVAELAAEWLEANPLKRSSSLERDQSTLRNHVLPALGALDVTTVTRQDVQRLVDRWAIDHAPSTAIRHYAVLRAIFSYGVDTERLLRSPCRRIRLPRGQLVERPVLSADELERLAGELGFDQATMMWVGAVLGLRWAEVAGLTVDRLDVPRARLTVDRQLARSGRLEPPKSVAGVRSLACPAWLVEDLATILRRRGITAALGDELIFLSPDGSPLQYTNWRQRLWVPACRRAGLSGLRFHDLRSLAATALIAVGSDVKTAQARLGHSSARMTLDLYAKVTVEADRSAAERVGKLLRPSRGAARATGCTVARARIAGRRCAGRR